MLMHSAESVIEKKQHSHFSLAEGFLQGALKGLVAFVTPRVLDVRVGDVRLLETGRTPAKWWLQTRTPQAEYHMELQPGSLWQHGNKGVVDKLEGKQNLYVSVPFVRAQGVRKDLNTGTRSEVCGSFWFDHEIHVQSVEKVNWNWVAARFPDGRAYMFYSLWTGSDSTKTKVIGEFFDNNTQENGVLDQVKLEPSRTVCLKSGNCYPQHFEASFLNRGKPEKLKVTGLFPEQEIVSPESKTYWEGIASALDSSGKKGFAYVEMAR
jgi:predicted secreted hydrolase